MLTDLPRKIRNGTYLPKSYRNSCCIGCKAENVELCVAVVVKVTSCQRCLKEIPNFPDSCLGVVFIGFFEKSGKI